jgi:predicted lactoylglutathione lyase
VALSVEGREKVNRIINKAIKAGGREYRELQDHGWMDGCTEVVLRTSMDIWKIT